MRAARRIVLLLFLVLVPAALAVWRYYHPPSVAVAARVETVPVRHARDAADDVALWVDVRDPAASLVIGTDKKGGLAVYDLTGAEVQHFENGDQNNVDLREGFPFHTGPAAIVVTSATAARAVFVYRLDASQRRLELLESSAFGVGVKASGICLYRETTEKGLQARTYCFVNGTDLATDEEGVVEQWELRADPDGDHVVAERVRRFDVGGRVEGSACDDAQGFYFVSEEKVAVWRYGAAAEAGEERAVLERVGLRGRLRGDAEGIALYVMPDGGGHLVISSQGSDDFIVYDRRPPHAYRGRFRLTAGPGVDAVTHTDGIDACAAPLGALFPDGLFVAQDDENDDENQDFKLASWRDIAAALELTNP